MNIIKANLDDFLSSDHHIGHYNIINYCKRPFYSIQEMDYILIKNWNDNITNNDIVFYLGDFCMNPKYYQILLQFNFKKIYFIIGNHDKRKKLQKLIDEYNLNIEIFDNLIIEVDNKQYYLTHMPINCSDNIPSIIGHVHEKFLKLNKNSIITHFNRQLKKEIKKELKQSIINVGVDVHNFKPLKIRDCLKILNGE